MELETQLCQDLVVHPVSQWLYLGSHWRCICLKSLASTADNIGYLLQPPLWVHLLLTIEGPGHDCYSVTFSFFPQGYLEILVFAPPNERWGMTIRPSVLCWGCTALSIELPCTAVLFLSLKGQRATLPSTFLSSLSKSFFSLGLQSGEGRSGNTYFFCCFPFPLSSFLFPESTCKGRQFLLSYLDLFYVKTYDQVSQICLCISYMGR